MGKRATVVFAVVFFLVLGVGGATAAEKAQPSRNVTSTSRGAANTQPSQNVTNTWPGTGKAKLPKDVTSTPTGKALNDLAKGNQPAGHVYDGQKGNPPPVQVDKSTSTITPEQAIKNYMNSGPPPGVRIKPAKEPPPPPPPPKKK